MNYALTILRSRRSKWSRAQMDTWVLLWVLDVWMFWFYSRHLSRCWEGLVRGRVRQWDSAYIDLTGVELRVAPHVLWMGWTVRRGLHDQYCSREGLRHPHPTPVPPLDVLIAINHPSPICGRPEITFFRYFHRVLVCFAPSAMTDGGSHKLFRIGGR